MKRIAIWLVGILALSLKLSSAHASALVDDGTSLLDGELGATPTVLYSQSSLVRAGAANLITLNAPSAGEVFLSLMDLGFPESLGSLKFSLSNSPTALVGLANPGTLTLYVTGATTLYASVYATAQGSADMGLYNLTETFLGGASPVPLPPPGLLLGASLIMALLALGARRFLALTRSLASADPLSLPAA